MSRESYEEVPYPTSPYSETHPLNLQTLATLFGLKPPPIENARVLELGCATGGNIVPMASAWPQAKFVGIDYSARQIEEAQRFASACDAKNLSLKTISILEISKDFGQFDYIIAHGIYSWVPADVREKTLQICRENLSDNGVAYVSFNALPGWHVRQWLRDYLLVSAPSRKGETSAQHVARVREAFGRLLSMPHMRESSLRTVLEKTFEDYVSIDEAFLLHDLLETVSTPFYFEDFLAALERNGLQYVTDALMRAQIGASTEGGWIHREKLLDFYNNHSFRRALIVRGEQHVERDAIEKTLSQRIGALRASAFLKTTAGAEAIDSAEGVDFRDAGGNGMNTNFPPVKRALLKLSQIFPVTIAVDELIDAGSLNPAWRVLAYSQLFEAWKTRLIQFCVMPARFAVSLPQRPRLWSVAKHQLSIGAKQLTNLRHDLVPFDKADAPLRAVLSQLDGTHSVDDLIARHTPAVRGLLQTLVANALLCE